MTHVTRKFASLNSETIHALTLRWRGLLTYHYKCGDVLSDEWLDINRFIDDVPDLPGFSKDIVYNPYTMFRVYGREPFSPDNTLFIKGRIPSASTRNYLTVRKASRGSEDLIVNKRAAADWFGIHPITMASHADSGLQHHGLIFDWTECTPQSMNNYIKQGRAYV